MKKIVATFLGAVLVLLSLGSVNKVQAALTDNLIGYWKLDEVSGSRLDSVGSNNLTDLNTVTQQPGKLGSAAKFTNTSAESLSIADNAQLSTGGVSFTVSAWVYLDSKISQSFVSKYQSLAIGEFSLYYNVALDRFIFSTYGNGTYYQANADSLGNVSPNTWYFLTGTHDATTNTNTITVNSSLTNSASSVEHANSTASFYIGRFHETSPLLYANARIDSVGFWKRVLTSGEISELYNGGNGLEYPFEIEENDITPPVISSIASTPLTTTASVTWTTDELADSQVFYGTSSNNYTSNVSSASFVNSHSINLTGLSADTTYYYYVVSEDESGNISTSTERTFITSEQTTYLQILSTGQSLATVYYATPAISTTQPYNNVMLTNGVEGTSAPLIPLIEAGTGEGGNVETISSGMANSLRANDSLERPIAVGLHAHSGTAYSGLKKGTSWYTKGMLQASTTKSYVENVLQQSYRPIAVTSIHGETDHANGVSVDYQEYLEEWQSDYESDLNALTGLNDTIPLFINQMNAASVGAIPVAQLNAHKDNPGKIIVVEPKYQYHYRSDKLHMDVNTEEKRMGEMFAKVMNKVIFEEEEWNPLMPTAIERAGNVITIDYHIPEGTLAIDTSTVAQRPNYGFEFTQTGGNSVSISSVELINGNTQVKITLTNVPTGTNQYVRYAYSCYMAGTWCAQAGSATAVGGNIRDTDTSVSQSIDGSGLPLYDWGVTFNEPVVDISETVPPSRSAASPTGTLAFNTTSTTLSLTTNEASTCKYGTSSGATYGSMASTFGTTGETTHSTNITGLSNGNSYTYYVRCIDAQSNANTDDYSISFSVAGDTDEPEEESHRTSTVTGYNSLVIPIRSTDTSACRPGDAFSTQTGAQCPLSTSNPIPSPYLFTRNLSWKMEGEDVRALQIFLNSHGTPVAPSGIGSRGQETAYFGLATRAALAKYQLIHNISPAVGFFGPLTRGYVLGK